MAAMGVIEILWAVPFYIYIANLSVNVFSLPWHMIIALATKDLVQVKHARSDEPNTEDEPRFDSTTHTNAYCVETNSVV